MARKQVPSKGFTLIELVLVIVIGGALSLVVMQFITRPIEVYQDQARRAHLVDQAQLVARHMVRELRLALPNSVRVGCGGDCIEFMRAVSGGRYRRLLPGNTLSFIPAEADSSFEVLGTLNHTTGLQTSNVADACENGTAACVVVYNTGFAGTNVWANDNKATLVSIAGSPSVVSFDNSQFSAGRAAFPAQSPGQRFYLVDTALSFICDPANRTLSRFQGYAHQVNHANADSAAELAALSNPAEQALLSDTLQSCDFTYVPGTPTRNALVTLRLSFSLDGEVVSLMEQVHMSNIP